MNRDELFLWILTIILYIPAFIAAPRQEMFWMLCFTAFGSYFFGAAMYCHFGGKTKRCIEVEG